jgi:hypothetical protein
MTYKDAKESTVGVPVALWWCRGYIVLLNVQNDPPETFGDDILSFYVNITLWHQKGMPGYWIG